MHGAHLHILDHKIRDNADYLMVVDTRDSLIDRLNYPGISDFERRDIARRIEAWDHVIEAYVSSKKNRRDISSPASPTDHGPAWSRY